MVYRKRTSVKIAGAGVQILVLTNVLFPHETMLSKGEGIVRFSDIFTSSSFSQIVNFDFIERLVITTLHGRNWKQGSLKFAAKFIVFQPLSQWFPTGGSRTPGGPKQDFQGSEMRFFRVRVCMSLDEHFFKRTDIYENLQSAITQKINII